MPIPYLEFDLSETERAVQETMHRFAVEVVRPAGEKLDKLPVEDVIAKDSIFWDVRNQYAALGFGSGFGDGDVDADPVEAARIQWIASEMLGWADSGIAIAMGAGGFPSNFATMSGNAELIEKFPADEIGCWAITEPDHGSDMIDFEDKIIASGAKRGTPNCIARADGNEYVISGQKSAWVSNGTIAKSAALYCAVETADGQKGGAVFLVRLDNDKGVTKGKPTDKIGQRSLNQGEVFFDGVRVPADHMIVGPDEYRAFTAMTLTTANTGMGTCFAGVARAAFELALDYAKERVQGGVPIIHHQSVKGRIFEMYRKVMMARMLNFRQAMSIAHGAEPSLAAAISSKVTSTQYAFEVASDALQIFGGAGISKEYPIEKIFRDARISMIEDGCNHVLGLVGADLLAAE